MKTEFDIPTLKGIPIIPAITEGAMAHSKPYRAKPEHQEALGFPGELVEDWRDKAIAKLDELLHKYRSLRVFMDTCVKCGAWRDRQSWVSAEIDG